jgi:hypothetical protein
MNTLNALIVREPAVCFSQINDEEIVVLNTMEEIFYHLNETAVDLWLSLESPKSVLELSQVLAEKYLEPIENYQQDVWEWVLATQEKGLLKVLDSLDVKSNA